MFEIKLKSILLPFKGGFYEVERLIHQQVEFDISMKVSSASFLASGDLSDTVDYGAVVSIIREVMETENTLLESMATGVSRKVLGKFQMVRSVSVTVRKWPQLGCPHEGVEVSYIAKQE